MMIDLLRARACGPRLDILFTIKNHKSNEPIANQVTNPFQRKNDKQVLFTHPKKKDRDRERRSYLVLQYLQMIIADLTIEMRGISIRE